MSPPSPTTTQRPLPYATPRRAPEDVTSSALQVVASLRYYPVPYQWARFGILTGVSVGLYLTSTVVSGPLPVAIAAKLGLVLSFPFLLWLLGFFEEAELQQVQRLRAGVLKRLVPSRA